MGMKGNIIVHNIHSDQKYKIIFNKLKNKYSLHYFDMNTFVTILKDRENKLFFEFIFDKNVDINFAVKNTNFYQNNKDSKIITELIHKILDKLSRTYIVKLKNKENNKIEKYEITTDNGSFAVSLAMLKFRENFGNECEFLSIENK